MGKILIERTGKVFNVMKDFRDSSIGEISQFIAEIELTRLELLSKYQELREEHGVSIEKKE